MTSTRLHPHPANPHKPARNRVHWHIAKGVLILSFCLIAFGARCDVVDERITWIKQEYSEIRASLKNYKQYSFDFSGESAEGASGIGYAASDKDIKLIEVTYYGESGKAKYEIYYFKGQPFFILKQNFNYNVPFYITEEMAKTWREEDGTQIEAFDPNKTEISEWRYYFDSGQVIRTLDPGKKEVKPGEEAHEAYRTGIKNLKRLEEKLKKQT